ncbi:MAG TPA: diacylglycerol kinase family protein [Pilimelia sp.]|nr:diacylglycerol kinase family protein [Pilimelia sp.]
MVGAEASAVDAVPAETTRAQRWLARLAFVAAAAAIILMLAVAGLRGSIALILVGSIGVAVGLAGAWWFLAHRGLVRWLALVLVLAGPIAIVVLYARAGLVWLIVVCALLWSAAVAAGRVALTTADSAYQPTEYEVPPPRRPFLIMNPRSGGGKVVQFGLAEKARELGATVALLEGPGVVDVAALARRAVDEGADLLGVAGGDGTQALVAGIAAERGIPFMVISAGTRNHFALDLGLDREDPPASLTALTDGVELHIDLGQIGDRTFVNNASFGAYAAVVQSPAYRDDKTRTTLDMLPDLLTRHSGPVLRMRAGETVLTGAQAILVSNNPYGSDDIAGLGRRTRIDGGVLGVLAVTVRGAADAASLVRGRRSKVVTLVAAGEAVVDADAPSIPVGIDGEAVSMAAPVRCVIRPGALRVRVPRQRPGNYQARPAMDWRRLGRIALSTGRSPRR